MTNLVNRILALWMLLLKLLPWPCPMLSWPNVSPHHIEWREPVHTGCYHFNKAAQFRDCQWWPWRVCNCLTWKGWLLEPMYSSCFSGPTRRAISHQGMTVEELEDIMDLVEWTNSYLPVGGRVNWWPPLSGEVKRWLPFGGKTYMPLGGNHQTLILFLVTHHGSY